jgi:hypothetical protein
MQEEKLKMRQIPYEFECVPYGELEQVTPLISKGRLKIYYIGKNRNMSYITKLFSDKLQAYLPYTPIVGVYDKYSQDFRGHELDRNAANTYGLVPENPNVAWETFRDKDGVEREYLCCDVYLYTGRYDAAKKIIGKSHSMELNRDSLQGFWKMIDGEEYYVFTHGFFDGLCVLGDRVEPCFEGSAFFEKKKSDSVIDLLEKYVQSKTNKVGDFTKITEEDMTVMSEQIKNMIDLEDEAVVDSVEEAIEETSVEAEVEVDVDDVVVEEVEEIEEVVETEEIEEVAEVVEADAEVESDADAETDDVADAFEEAEADSEIEAEVEAPAEEVVEEIAEVEEEAPVEDSPEIASDASFAEICEHFAAVREYYEQTSSEILELRQRVGTLETEASNLQASLEQYQRAEEEALNSQKQEMIDSYANLLSVDAMQNFKENMGDYSLESLKKEILFKIDEENPSFFKRTEEPKAFSSFRTKEENGIIGILNKHKNKL